MTVSLQTLWILVAEALLRLENLFIEVEQK